MQFDWLMHALGVWATWALAAVALWRSSRSRRQAFWVWLTDEHFYKGFGFLGLLWPQLQRKRVWPKAMEDAKVVYLERLEKARQYRGGQLPKWWVAIANIRFLVHMAFHLVEMSRTIVVCNRGTCRCLLSQMACSASTAWLSEDQRERYKEEWQSYINEVPGVIGKIVVAVGFMFAAKRRPCAERVALSGAGTVHSANSGKLFIAVSGKMETSGRVFPRLVRQCAKCGKTFPVSGNKILCNDCDN